MKFDTGSSTNSIDTFCNWLILDSNNGTFNANLHFSICA
jgi:hypothetical protein